MKISQRAFDMTVAEEVTSKPYYIKHYQRPEWPGLSSGVTIGIGYDLGQSLRAKIAADWGKLVDANMLLVMQSCAGLTGEAGRRKCAEVKNLILIPWDAAISVFANRDVPAWTATVLKAVPGADKLTPSCLGVLFDIAYNRGAGGFNSSNSRFAEMRAIRDHVGAGKLSAVPVDISMMKRLWPNTAGLLRRCDHRIALWNQGLTTIDFAAAVAATPVTPDPEVPTKEGPARTKPPATTKTQNATTASLVVGPMTAAVSAGLTPTQIVLIFIASVMVAGGVWFAWYRNRNPK